MPVELEVRYWLSLDKGFNQHHFFRVLLDWRGEVHIFSFFEHLLEFVEVPHLKGKIDLLD